MEKNLGNKLLLVARATLEGYLQDGIIPQWEAQDFDAEAHEPRGCFVTLKKDHELRGCIGTITPHCSLLQGVVHNAISSATEDRRFEPVTYDELATLTIELSVLTTPQRLIAASVEAILDFLQPQVHGIILKMGMNQATYLPQVWHDLPEKVPFLESLCMKGHMPKSAWRDPAMTIFYYEAEIFGPDHKGTTHL